MPARARTLAVVALLSLGLGVPALPATADTVSRGVTIPAFYTPPASLPAAAGALVRSEPLPLAASLPGLDGRRLPGTATRLMYRTTDSNGQPVAATGAYVEPSAAWTGKGARPLVVVAPGTMGQGDQCSASLGLQYVVLTGDGTVSFGYEILSVYQLLSKGAAVVLIDYIGLGTTDRLHTYVNRVDEGHAVLDAARAALQVPGASVTSRSPVGLYGYSQGGGAVAAAAELQRDYAPDVRLRGTYAGAAPADLGAVTTAIDGSELAGALGWSINGFVQSDPELSPVLDRYLSAAGRAALADLSTMCVGDALLAYGGKQSSAWTTNGQTITQIVAAEPAVQAFIREQRIGLAKPTGPVRVATGISDNLVPHRQARQLALDWCAQGAAVTYAAPFFPDVGSKTVNHVLPLLADQGSAIGWLTDRLAGRPAGNDCWAVPLTP